MAEALTPQCPLQEDGRMTELDTPAFHEITDAIRLMRERLESGQGTAQDAMCRLSLTMAEELHFLLDKARDAASWYRSATAKPDHHANVVLYIEGRYQLAQYDTKERRWYVADGKPIDAAAWTGYWTPIPEFTE